MFNFISSQFFFLRYHLPMVRIHWRATVGCARRATVGCAKQGEFVQSICTQQHTLHRIQHTRQPFRGPLKNLGFDFYWKQVNFNCVWKCLFIKMLDKVSRLREAEVRVVSRKQSGLMHHKFAGSILCSVLFSILVLIWGSVLGFNFWFQY